MSDNNVVIHYEHHPNSKKVIISTNSNRDDGEFVVRIFNKVRNELKKVKFQLRFRDFHIHTNLYSNTTFSISFDHTRNVMPASFTSGQPFLINIPKAYTKTIHIL